MKNAIVTISSFAAVLLVILTLSQGLFAELNEGDDRVASLEGRVEEMEENIEQLNNELASATDVIEQKDIQIASLTDAVDEVKEKIEEEQKTTTEQQTSEESLTEEQTTQYVELEATTNSDNDNNDAMVFGTKRKDYKEEIDDDDAVASEDIDYSYLGVYELTAYEATGNACADGSMPVRGYTVACNSLPLGTRIYIEGYGEFTVCDRGGMSGSVIDIYLGDYSDCIQFGRRSAAVYIIN